MSGTMTDIEAARPPNSVLLLTSTFAARVAVAPRLLIMLTAENSVSRADRVGRTDVKG